MSPSPTVAAHEHQNNTRAQKGKSPPRRILNPIGHSKPMKNMASLPFPPHPSTNNSIAVVGSSKAHEMKIALGNTPLVPTPTNARRRIPEHDPENHIIKRMRTDESRSWADIARHLNEERIKAGKVSNPQAHHLPKSKLTSSQNPTFTEAAVYSRFVRNSPRLAAAEGEADFNPRDYMHLKNSASGRGAAAPGFFASGSSTGAVSLALPASERFGERDDELLVEAFAEVQGGFWESVARILEEKSGKKYGAVACAKRYQVL